ncbi:oxidoreductase [Fusarium acutatum]|uniref:Oxidoreductase n=1 Tax=Fusarium acutatum TaxID=78861 RepID=A0A8H4JYP0_9HYPO|nr:oxidoreductase [Fusarium acutatum]
MVSLRDIGLLLFAAPIALAAPKVPAEVTVKTLPFSQPADTSKAPSSSADASSPASEAAQKAACQLPLRWTNFALYSDTGCKNVIYDPFMLTWDPCKSYQWTNALANGVIFQSMRWTGGSNAQDFYACSDVFLLPEDGDLYEGDALSIFRIISRYLRNLYSMSHTLEPNVAAVLPVKQGQLTIQLRPVPAPKAGELVVRNAVVAANPSDWKFQAFGLSTNFPAVLGSDLSGVVVSVGTGVTRFKPGDRVIAFALGVISGNSDKAAFQTYTLLDEVATTHLPESISFEEGSVLPVGVLTAAIALFDGLRLPMREKSVEENGAILVWSGASAVGVSAVQIAHALGWTVYATASPKHHEWLKTLGAAEAWDYRDPQVAQKVAQALKSSRTKIRGVIDARAEDSSFNSVAEILTTADLTPGCKATALMPWPKDTSLPAGIGGHHTNCMGFTENYPDIASWVFGGWLSKVLEDGRIKPAPRVRLIEGKLGATQEMLNLLKAGASGEKFVLKV